MKFEDEQQLEDYLSQPNNDVVEMFKTLKGDILFLGIAGKIGPSLALMAKRACESAGVEKEIYGVSRFSSNKEREHLEELGIKTIKGDLLDREFLESLPKVENVFFLAGMKFGAEGNPSLTWAMNTFLPGLVAENFKTSRIVVYSTGCVYPLVTPETGGSKEVDNADPVGEYAQSCLGRERMFEYGSKKNESPVVLFRLNYAVEPRYGVLVDIAQKVRDKQTIDLSMGYFNVIWQGDANNIALLALKHTEVPANILNVSGPEILSVRKTAEEFGKLFGVKPEFSGSEASSALLTDSSKTYSLMGEPKVSMETLIRWIGHWVLEEKRSLSKPTRFEVRDGKY